MLFVSVVTKFKFAMGRFILIMVKAYIIQDSHLCPPFIKPDLVTN